jgi:hypothetical protein
MRRLDCLVDCKSETSGFCRDVLVLPVQGSPHHAEVHWRSYRQPATAPMPIRDVPMHKRPPEAVQTESQGWSLWQGSSFSPGSGASGSLLGALCPRPLDATPRSPPPRVATLSVGSLPAFAFADSRGSTGCGLRSLSTQAGLSAQDTRLLSRASFVGSSAAALPAARRGSSGGLRSASAHLPARPWPVAGAAGMGFGAGGPHPQQQDENDDDELHEALCCPITQVCKVSWHSPARMYRCRLLGTHRPFRSGERLVKRTRMHGTTDQSNRATGTSPVDPYPSACVACPDAIRRSIQSPHPRPGCKPRRPFLRLQPSGLIPMQGSKIVLRVPRRS